MTRQQTAERQAAIDQLREWIKPGDTVYTICDSVSRSGMSRQIRVCVPFTTAGGVGVQFTHPNYHVGRALDLRHGKRHGQRLDSLTIGGCGMDMGFHLVNSLSYVLYPTYPCLGQDNASDGRSVCPSNYHANYRRTVRCDGFEGRICWAPDPYSTRFPVPDGWPRSRARTIAGVRVPGRLLACLHNDDDVALPQVCPTCKGAGSFPNPDGPERWDLVHTDGYALRHSWL